MKIRVFGSKIGVWGSKIGVWGSKIGGISLFSTRFVVRERVGWAPLPFPTDEPGIYPLRRRDLLKIISTPPEGDPLRSDFKGLFFYRSI